MKRRSSVPSAAHVTMFSSTSIAAVRKGRATTSRSAALQAGSLVERPPPPQDPAGGDRVAGDQHTVGEQRRPRLAEVVATAADPLPRRASEPENCVPWWKSEHGAVRDVSTKPTAVSSSPTMITGHEPSPRFGRASSGGRGGLSPPAPGRRARTRCPLFPPACGNRCTGVSHTPPISDLGGLRSVVARRPSVRRGRAAAGTPRRRRARCRRAGSSPSGQRVMRKRRRSAGVSRLSTRSTPLTS